MDRMTMGPAQLVGLPVEVQTVLDLVPPEYTHDLAVDLAWAALLAPQRPDALYQVIRDWEITLAEIAQAGAELPAIVQARAEARAGVGQTPAELRAYLANEQP